LTSGIRVENERQGLNGKLSITTAEPCELKASFQRQEKKKELSLQNHERGKKKKRNAKLDKGQKKVASQWWKGDRQRGLGATQKSFWLDERSRPAGESLRGVIMVLGAIIRYSAESRDPHLPQPFHALALGRHDRWVFFF
jgi:hypothetical protein